MLDSEYDSESLEKITILKLSKRKVLHVIDYAEQKHIILNDEQSFLKIHEYMTTNDLSKIHHTSSEGNINSSLCHTILLNQKIKQHYYYL